MQNYCKARKEALNISIKEVKISVNVGNGEKLDKIMNEADSGRCESSGRLFHASSFHDD